jgi:hypothetical protein
MDMLAAFYHQMQAELAAGYVACSLRLCSSSVFADLCRLLCLMVQQ